MPLINPLTQDHVDAINRVLRSISDIRETIKACEDCGLDMTQRRELLDAQEHFATQVKRIFMSHEP